MYDFKKAEPKVTLTTDWILSRIEDSQIFFYYFGRFEIGKAYCSKFGKDKNPSTTFFIGNNGRIIYYDFRNGDRLDCFSYVQKLYNVPFNKALEVIAADFGLIDRSTIKVSKKVIEASKELDRDVKRETLIQFIPEAWDSSNSLFWRFYDISIDELIAENVFPIKRLFVNKVEIINPYAYNRYAFPETFDGDKIGVKIYSPKDPKMKWLSSIPLDVPFGLNNLSFESNIVFITKSKKDLIILKKLFPCVIATQNESKASLNDDVITLLKNSFDKQIIVFDNDEVGVENSKKLNELGFDYFNIPKDAYESHGIKDPSDYVKYYGIEALEQLFKRKNLL